MPTSTPRFSHDIDFRKRRLPALSDLFKQVLLLCGKAGLVKLGHVALDGTKVKANASKHKAMSDGRMVERAPELEAQVAGGCRRSGRRRRGQAVWHDNRRDEMPDWVADKQRSAEKISQAKAELEAEAAAEARVKRAGRCGGEARKPAGAKGGRTATPPCPMPHAKAQKNLTDPQSRIRDLVRCATSSSCRWHSLRNTAAAGDLEPRPVPAVTYTWSGLYLGANIGGGDVRKTCQQ